MIKRFVGILITMMFALALFPGSAQAEPLVKVPGTAVSTHGTTYGNIIVFTIKAKNLIPGTTVVVRTQTCSGKWTYRKVTGKSGTFVFKTQGNMNKLPNRLPMRIVLKHEGYKNTVSEESTWKLEGMAKC